jgi:hypothetical protein
MIQGYFDEEVKLYFEIDLIAADGSVITVNALLDIDRENSEVVATFPI